MDRISIKMGELKVIGNPNVLTSGAIGSCVVVTIYDSKKKIGGLAHTMLSSSNQKIIGNPYKYSEIAIDEILKQMEAKGSRKKDMEAKLIGGAELFSNKNPTLFGIGNKNVEAIKNKLNKEGIEISAFSTGGSIGRQVEFDLKNGIIKVISRA